MIIEFLSGCTGVDWGDPLGIEAGSQVCCLSVVGIVILIVILLIGLARAGTKKNIVIQSGISEKIQDFKEQHRKPSEKDRFCPNCGRSIPFDAKLCPYCGKKFEESKP